jgi:hypothetical protein
MQMLAFSEGLILAERGGIDPRRAAEVMTRSAIGSPNVADEILTEAESLGYAHRDIAALHEVLTRTPVAR